MESVYLKTLVEVVRAGSISKAADTLCVTQPAVSRRIKFIEEQYGYQLLDRSGQTLVPTGAGKLVFDKAELMLSIERELLSCLRSIKKKQSIAFICTPTFGITHLPMIIREFMIKHKDSTQLSFMFDMPTNILEALRDGMYDLAVLDHCEGLDFSNLTKIPLPGDDLVFVSSPKLGLPEGNIDLDELLSQAIFSCKEGSCPYTRLEINLNNKGKNLSDLKSFTVIDDLQMIIQLVLDGQGVSLLSREIVLDKLETGLLLEHNVDEFDLTRMRSLVVNGQAHQLTSSPLNYFIDRIKSRFE